MFAPKQIIWAKTKGYPWWPAEINKLPTPDQNFFRVTFVGQTNHAHLEEKAVKKYLENYDTLTKVIYKGLQNSIELADMQLQKRTTIMTELENKVKVNKIGTQKSKKIKKKTKKKQKAMKNLLKQIKPLNDHLKSFQADEPQKNEKKPSDQCSAVKMAEPKQGDVKSDMQSVLLSDSESEVQVIELDYLGNIDRKRIQNAEEKLFIFITQFNSGIYQKQRECFEVIDKIDKEDLKPQQLLQSKITNMITYIHKKLSQRVSGQIKKQQIAKMSSISHKLKSKVVDYLFDCKYYDQFLKLMDKNSTLANHQKEEKAKAQPRPYTKKSRRIKRKPFTKRKLIIESQK